MSSFSSKRVLCSPCGAVFTADLWDSVNTRCAELVESLIDGTLNTVTCPNCGTTGFLPTPVLYHDMERSLWIQIGPTSGAPGPAGRHADTGLAGVRYRPRLTRPIQFITIEDFELARQAIRALVGDEAIVRQFRQAHPEWPHGVVYAHVLLYHCRRLLSRPSELES